MSRYALLTVCLATACHPSDGFNSDFVADNAGWMHGTVLDYVSGTPIPGAEVTLLGSVGPMKTRSDAEGKYAFVPAESVNPFDFTAFSKVGSFEAVVSANGYTVTRTAVGAISQEQSNHHFVFGLTAAAGAALRAQSPAGHVVIADIADYGPVASGGFDPEFSTPDAISSASVTSSPGQNAQNMFFVAANSFQSGDVTRSATPEVASLTLAGRQVTRSAVVMVNVPVGRHTLAFGPGKPPTGSKDGAPVTIAAAALDQILIVRGRPVR